MKLLKGKEIADKILENIKQKIEKEKLDVGLAVILVGKNKASDIYVRLKKEAAEKIGINFYLFKFKKSEENLENKTIKKITDLNTNKKISGIIVQLPLPGELNTQKIISSISPHKDVDGFHPENIKLFLGNREIIWPVFPKAIIKMIESASVKFSGKKVVVVANSEKFGKIMTETLRRKNIKADRILTGDIKKNISIIKQADIIVTACGIPRLIKGEMIKKGVIIIDGGIAKKGNKVFGDVDMESVKNIAAFLSPVPGGVGSVTVACLLENVYLITLNKYNLIHKNFILA